MRDRRRPTEIALTTDLVRAGPVEVGRFRTRGRVASALEHSHHLDA